MQNNNIDQKQKESIEVYDTTLRDGTQGEGFSLSIDDKLMIADIVDELGIHFIEEGFHPQTPRIGNFLNLRLKRDLKIPNWLHSEVQKERVRRQKMMPVCVC